MSLIGSLIAKIETKDASLSEWVLAFMAVIAVRTMAEGFSAQQPIFLFETVPMRFYFFHLPLFYLVSFLGLASVLKVWTGESAKKACAFVLSAFPIILLPVAIDAWARFAFDKNVPTFYQTFPVPMDWADVPKFVFDYVFSGPLYLGMTPSANTPFLQTAGNYGIHVELSILLIVIFWYVFEKTGSLLKGAGSVLTASAGLFPVSFVMSLLLQFAGEVPTPTFLKVGAPHFPTVTVRDMSSAMLLYMLVPLVAYLWATHDKKEFLSMLKNFRPNRTIHVFVLMALGVTLGQALDPAPRPWSAIDLQLAAMAFGAMAFEWFAAVCFNDIADRKGDALCMTDRPLVTGVVSEKRMAEFGWIFLAVAYALSLFVSGTFFLFVLTKSAISHLYSSRTYRLKALPLVSNFALAAAYLVTIVGGYSLVLPNGVLNFPSDVALAILSFYTFATTFKDIKDYEGDRADGIRSIPVIFGLRNGKRIIAALGTIGCLSVPFLLGDVSILTVGTALAFSSVFALLVTAEQYREGRVFALFYSCVGITVAYAAVAWH